MLHAAEYRALIRGLELARSGAVESIRVCLDSALVVNQMSGKSRVKAEHVNSEACSGSPGEVSNRDE